MATTLSADETVLEVLIRTDDYLARHGVIPSRQEAELLLAYVLECERIALYLDRGKIFPVSAAERFQELAARRAQGMPLQYLTKQTNFYGLNFYAEPGVFIPRPETEVLAEYCINLLRNSLRNSLRVLELCVGSGALAVTLTKHVPECTIIAVDCDSQALSLAGKNASLHGVAERITLLPGDLFGALSGVLTGVKFDLIVANPPYIAFKDLEALPREVQYEPRAALDGGADGLEFYRNIIRSGGSFLQRQGTIAFECGDAQHADVCGIIRESGIFESISTFPDLNGIHRFISAKLKNG